MKTLKRDLIIPIAILIVFGVLFAWAYRSELPTVKAQSGTTCCKIDPVIISVDDQGNLVVYHAKGPLTLPAGSTTVYTGTSLSQALTISEDTLYAVKGSQQ